MAALLVTYDLNSPGQRHADLLEFLKKTFAWAKLSESSYAISTNKTQAQGCAQLWTAPPPSRRAVANLRASGRCSNCR